MSNELYNRQKKLDLQYPESVAVIGIGGVGSWVAVNMALTGVKKLVLIDHDIVEQHNLNRTLFKLSQINKPKTIAISEIIYERRSDISVLPITKKIEDTNQIEKDEISEANIIIDCRDNSTMLPEPIMKKVKIVGGYDGNKITIHINPDYSKIWGDGQVRYSITPSWLCPPQLIANIITSYLCFPDEQITSENIINFKINEVLKCIKSTNGITG